MTDKLDAYGHLNWTVGNEDWLACFDARRVGNEIEYHVIVDCESGGFTDTIERGAVPATAEGIANLSGLPDMFFSVCCEHYIDDPALTPSMQEYLDCERSWREHLEYLLSAESEEEAQADLDNAEEAAWYEELNRGYAKDRITT